MRQDGFTEIDADAAEAIAAVGSVVTETLERSGEDLDGAWQALATAGLLSLAVPEDLGGEGLGLAEIAVLLRETGRRAVQLPVWETLCCGVLTLVAAGSDEQCRRLLPGVASGELLLTPALREVGAGLPEQPSTTYTDRDGAGRLTGRKIGVTYADRAERLLVSATAEGRPVVALVDPRGPGVELIETPASTGGTQHTVVLDGAPAELLAGEHVARTLRDLAVAGLCLTAAGVVAGARDLTATYIKGRTQFGRSLAEFQAVAMQIADVYITSRTLDLAAQNAAWRIGSGLDVTDDLAVAAYWVCHEAPGATRTCHHLHGGMGVDITYPVGSSRVDLQACKLEYSIVSPK